MYLYALCHQVGGGVLQCRFDPRKIDNPAELETLFDYDREIGDFFRVLDLTGVVDMEAIAEMQALLSLTLGKKDSHLAEFADKVLTELLTAGMHLQQTVAIDRC